MTTLSEQVEALIHQYGYVRGDLTEQYAREQLRDKILALLPEVTETVEWSLMRGTRPIITPRPNGRWNEQMTLAEARDAWYPDCQVVSRTVTTYATRYTEWTEATP